MSPESSTERIRKKVEDDILSMKKELKDHPEWHTSGYLDGEISYGKEVLRFLEATSGEADAPKGRQDG